MNNTRNCWPADPTAGKTGCNRFLLLVTGLGGRLSGADVGIIAGALPYLEETSGLNAGRLSQPVSSVTG
jgi:SP family myo-inositol transporter-like MFS transporter 13